jgi:hypothetical protein
MYVALLAGIFSAMVGAGLAVMAGLPWVDGPTVVWLLAMLFVGALLIGSAEG